MSDRRKFLTHAGLLLGGLGVAQAFRMDLMDRLARKVFPQSHASEGPRPHRILEITFRSGIPVIMFATGREFTQLTQPRYANFTWAGNEIIQSSRAPNMYFNIDSMALEPHAANVAITQGVQVEGGHTQLFAHREGGRGQGKASPIVELADLNTTGSIVHGLRWQGPAVNSTAGRRDLVQVNENGLNNLYAKPRLALSDEDMAKVAEAASQLSRRQAMQLQNLLRRSSQVANNQSKVRELLSIDYTQLLNTEDMGSDFQSPAYNQIFQRMGLSLKALEHNLTNSVMLTIPLGDWHGYQQDKSISIHAREMSRLIANTIAYLKRTPDLATNGLTLWDTTVIMASSEFTRGVSKFNRDNNDGGTTGMLIAGKNIKGGYYGGFELEDNPDRNQAPGWGFDLATGTTTSGQRNTNEQMYNTMRAAAGLRLEFGESQNMFRCMFS